MKELEKKWISVVCDTTETTYVFFTTLVRDQEVEGSNPLAPDRSVRPSLDAVNVEEDSLRKADAAHHILEARSRM